VDPTLWKLAARGFQDMSRLAASQVDMSLDILLTNRENILAQLEAVKAELGHIGDALYRGDEESLRKALGAAREARRTRYP
jgi:prephenate dehydrogenase